MATGGIAQVSMHAPVLQPASVPASTAVPASKPVVKVNGTVLTQSDLVREMLNVFPYAKQHGGKFPKDAEPEIRKKAMRNLEFEELAYQQAQKRGMTVAPAKLNKAMKDFRDQFETEAQFQQYLKVEQRGSMQELRSNIQRAILIDQIMKVEVTSKAKFTDAQALAFYQKNPDRFRKPDSISIQTITIAYGDNPSAAAKQKARKAAEDALAQAQATKDYESFGLLAEKVSMDDWRVVMGDHKWLHRGRMPKQVEDVVFNLKAGQMTGIIDTGDSFCIARVNGVEPAHEVPFDQVKAQLKKDLEQQKADELRASYEAQLRKNAKIEEL